MIIALDGPAASGKGTLARRLAAHYGYAHLDTGLLYRAVGHALLMAGQAPSDATAAESAARALDVSRMDPELLRSGVVGEAASVVAAIPNVRAVLLDAQRAFANQSPGAVLDGRDIGTVVCPDADVKLYVMATPDVRARRRHAELVGRGEVISEVDVLEDIRRRDDRDQSRTVAPAKPAKDAHLLDTTELDIDGAFRKALELVERFGKSDA